MLVAIRQLKQKYASLSQPVRAGLWYTVCNVLNKGISLLSTPIFTRIMTEEQYGTFAIFQSWYNILLIFTSLNMFLGSYEKGLLLYRDDVDGFTSSLLSLVTTITAGFALVYAVAVPFWTKVFELSPPLMIAMFVELFSMPALEFWTVRQKFEFRYRNFVIVSLLMNLLCLGTAVVAVMLTDSKVEARVFSDVGAKLLFAGSLFVMLMVRGKKFFDCKYWRYALAFNLPLIPHYLSNYVLNQSDRLMIGQMVGNAQAGFYSVAYTIATVVLLISTAVNGALTPYLFRRLEEKDTAGVKGNTAPLILLMTVLCVLTMTFAPEVIFLFAGQKYMDAIYVIPPVAASVFFIFLYSLFSSVEYFYQRTRGIAIATTVSALLNIALNYVGIKWFGYHAAGYTTLICYIGLAFCHYLFYRRIVREELADCPPLYDVRLILVSGGIMVGVTVLMAMTYRIIAVRYALVAVVVIAAIIKRRPLIAALKRLKNKE